MATIKMSQEHVLLLHISFSKACQVQFSYTRHLLIA